MSPGRPRVTLLGAEGSDWQPGPAPPHRGAGSATGPKRLDVAQDGEAPGREPLPGFQSIELGEPSFDTPEAQDPNLAGLQPRFEWNLIRNSDGTLTKVYFFRTDKPGAGAYLELMRRFIPGFAALRDGTDYRMIPKYLSDPRQPGDAKWKGGASALDLATGSQNTMDLFMVTADEMMLRQIDAFLQSMLAEMPQIGIEVTIVEIAMGDSLQTGLSATLHRGTPEEPESGLIDDVAVKLAQNLVTGAFGTFSAIHDENVINGVLELLQSTTYSNVLSSPKLAVLNGHRAVIDTGSETPVFTPAFNGTGLTSIGTSFQPTGITVVVTPFLLDKDTIQLEISIEVSAVTGFVTAGIGENAEIENPLIAERNAYTVVNVPVGQTVLLGGLVTQDEIENDAKVPLLGDIPLLGRLFRRSQRDRRRSQVLFLVTPTLEVEKSRPGVLYDPASDLR